MSRPLPADDAAVLAFANRLYERAEEEGGWHEALLDLADRLRGTGLALHRYDARQRRGTALKVLRATSIDQVAAEYPLYSEDNIWMQEFDAGPLPCPGDVIASHRLYPEADLLRHSYYNEFLKRYHLFSSVGAVLEVCERELTTVTILRDRRPGRFGEDEERFLARIAPHLRNVHRVEKRFAAARTARSVLADVLDRLPTAVIALDADLRVVVANQTADRLLTAHDGLRRSHGRLVLTDPAAQRSLRLAVSGLARGLRGEGTAAGAAFPIPRPSYLRPYAATVIPVRPLVPRDAAGAACCLLLVDDLEDEVVPPHHRLRELWGLTDAEATVAALLAKGQAPRDIADALEISFNTVRTHLQHIFLKTDTSRQGDLVRLLTRLAIVTPES